MYVVIEVYKLQFFLNFDYHICAGAIPTYKVDQLDDMYQGSAFNVCTYQQFILHKGIYYGAQKKQK